MTVKSPTLQSQSVHSRLLQGQQHRKQMRRAGHAGWDPKLRKEKPLDLLHRAEKGRVPRLLQLKHERMAVSPFTFFRGAVPIMAYDLSLGANTGIRTQICGDAHVRNLGAFAALDGRINFDINDFDETTQGPFEWDVKRMATSLILAGREAGIREGQCRDAAAAMLARYRESIHLFAHMPLLDAARFQVHRLGDVTPIAEIMRAAGRSTPMHNLEVLTVPVEDAKPPAPPRRFRSSPPVLEAVKEAERDLVLAALPDYVESLQPERRYLFSRYTFVDLCFKVVGTGSVGLRNYCLYLQGNGAGDPLFLQIKEETASAYAPYVDDHAKHQGRRVVDGERAMQFQSDPFLGWTQIDGRDYMVRQLSDHKASINLATLKSASLLEYAAVCGELLARGHARSGDSTILAGYLGQSERFDEAVLKYAASYADQTEVDWKALKKGNRE